MTNKVQVIREEEERWYVYNPTTDKSAYIHKINEYNALTGGWRSAGYRVDVGFKTVRSAIPNFQQAKSVAVKEVS